MKRNVPEGILALSLVLLTACGTGNDGEAVSLEPYPIETDTSVGEDKRSDDIPADTAETDVSASDAYGSIYLQAIREEEGSTKAYSLICLDNDNIPELVVLDRGYDSYTIYTVRDGAIFCMADSMTAVEMTYFERSGVIAEFSRWNGGGDEGGYGMDYYLVTVDRTLTDEDQPLLSFSYNAVYDDKGIYTGTGVTDYFHMDQAIDETAYKDMLESLSIAEGEGRTCMENAYSKEEMAELLGK